MVCLLICSFLCYADVVDEIVLQDGSRICIVLEEDGFDLLPVVTGEAPGGSPWRFEAPRVREDAPGGYLCSAGEGCVLAAVAYGTGYTDILLVLLGPDGAVLGSDTIAFTCYDSPYELLATEEGYTLLWDSWSEERGLHLAFIGPECSVDTTLFVAETVNPGPAEMIVFRDHILVAVSPLLAVDRVLFCFSSRGEPEWSVYPLLPQGADFITGLSADSAGITMSWRALTVTETAGDVHETLLEWTP